jgi:hypothetical protein
MNDVRYEASRHFRSKRRDYLKGEINELATDVRTGTLETCIEE